MTWRIDRFKTRCRSCGRSIIYGVDEKGTKHPLDVVVPTYRVLMDNGEPILGGPASAFPEVRRTEATFVPHFATCPNASKHSKKGGKKVLGSKPGARRGYLIGPNPDDQEGKG